LQFNFPCRLWSDRSGYNAVMQCRTLATLVSCLSLLSFAVGATVNEQAVAKKPAKAKAAKPKTPPKSFQLGWQEFQNKRFGPAAEQFELADRSGFCNDMTHYYLGLCYHNLNQTQRAIDHYSWVASYSKNPILRYQAQSGYAQVAKYAGNRTYAGNGNVFTGFSYRGGGGGSSMSSGGG